MILSINLNGDNAWPELKADNVIHLESGHIQVATLEGGTNKGAPSIAIRLDLPDGKTVIAETHAGVFITAAKLIEARFPEMKREVLPSINIPANDR